MMRGDASKKKPVCAVGAEERRIMIAGSGGQGILFLGKLLAHSAMLEGLEVTWFPSYGAEMRGGTANCTVVVARDLIGSPVVRNPDVLFVLNEASFKIFPQRLLPGGLLLYDSSLIAAAPIRDDIRVMPVPAGSIAAAMGNPKAANMVLLGAFVAAMKGRPAVDSVLRAVREATPDHRMDSLATNRELIMKGYRLHENT